jgi:hypothetical protein
MKDTIKVVAFVCDGCRKRKIVESPEDAYGYHGWVAHVWEDGGSGDVEFYACSTRCIGKAVQNAIKSGNEGHGEERTDPALTSEDLAEERATLAQARDYPLDAEADEDDLRARGLYPEGVPEPLER